MQGGEEWSAWPSTGCDEPSPKPSEADAVHSPAEAPAALPFHSAGPPHLAPGAAAPPTTAATDDAYEGTWLEAEAGSWPAGAAKLWEPLPSLATSPRLAPPGHLAPTRPRPHLVGCDGLELRERNLLLERGHQRRGRVPVDVRHRHRARVRALAQVVAGVGSGGSAGEGEGEGDGEYGTRVEFGLQLGSG